jgi:hypothetical protein
MKDFFTGFKKGMQSFGNGIAAIVNTTLLFVVYVVAVGPTSLVGRLFGKKFLSLEKKDRDSYWDDLNLGKKAKESYYRQF